MSDFVDSQRGADESRTTPPEVSEHSPAFVDVGEGIDKASKTESAKCKKARKAKTNAFKSKRTLKWLPIGQLIVESNRTVPENPDAMTQLAASIVDCGILDPVHVRFDEVLAKYRVTAGRRRVWAVDIANALLVQAGLPPLREVPCLVAEPAEETPDAVVDLITNYARQEMAPLDKAQLLKRAAEDRKCSAKELAQRLKLSPGTISELLSLLDLPEEALKRVRAGESAKLMGRTWRKLPSEYQTRVASGESLKAVIAEWKSTKSAPPRVDKTDEGFTADDRNEESSGQRQMSTLLSHPKKEPTQEFTVLIDFVVKLSDCGATYCDAVLAVLVPKPKGPKTTSTSFPDGPGKQRLPQALMEAATELGIRALLPRDIQNLVEGGTENGKG